MAPPGRPGGGPGGGPALPRGPFPLGGRLPLLPGPVSVVVRTSSPSMVCTTFSYPFRLRALATRFIAAVRCAGVISFKAMPPRGTNPVGRFDQRALCCWSSKAYITLRRCSASSEARNAFAADTIFAVSVAGAAALSESEVAASTARLQNLLRVKVFICILLQLASLLSGPLGARPPGEKGRGLISESTQRCRSSWLGLGRAPHLKNVRPRIDGWQ